MECGLQERIRAALEHAERPPQIGTSLHAVELFFTAGEACPLEIVARGVESMARPLMQVLDPSIISDAVVQKVTELTLSFAFETSAMRRSGDVLSQEVNTAGGLEAISRMRNEIAELRSDLEVKTKELEKQAVVHLESYEAFLVSAGVHHAAQQDKDAQVSALQEALSTATAQLGLLRRECDRYRSCALTGDREKTERDVAEASRAKVAQSEIGRLRAACLTTTDEVKALHSRERAWRDLLDLVQDEMIMRARLMFDNLVFVQGTGCEPFRRLVQYAALLRSNLLSKNTDGSVTPMLLGDPVFAQPASSILQRPQRVVMDQLSRSGSGL